MADCRFVFSSLLMSHWSFSLWCIMSEKSWPDYRAVWRWHFYAGLFCIPFVLVLSISGLIYLFKPQIEAWNERSFENLPLSG